MEARADIRLAPLPGDGHDTNREAPADPRMTVADLDAARELAEYHHLLAAELEPHSQLRGLVLRCAGHWSRLGAMPRHGLEEVDRG
jgi:hypothetical protein